MGVLVHFVRCATHPTLSPAGNEPKAHHCATLEEYVGATLVAPVFTSVTFWAGKPAPTFPEPKASRYTGSIMRKIKDILLNRKPNTHKGDYGHVFVIAGSLGMTGAAYLTAQAALLSGSGLVTLGMPKSLNTILARKLVEVMTKPLPETKGQSLGLKAFSDIKKFIQARRPNVLAIGPGLSQNRQAQALVRKIVSKISLPMVIDADGLNALTNPVILRGRSPKRSEGRSDRRISLLDSSVAGVYTERSECGSLRMTHSMIITPHPGEMARLLGTNIKGIQKDRKYIAKKFASDYNVIVVLKGHNTVVACPAGRVYINNTGNPGMASAGCGDVLTGMIASFLGQGIEPFEAAKLGVYLHGKAGDLAAEKAGQASLKAADVLNNIHRAIKIL